MSRKDLTGVAIYVVSALVAVAVFWLLPEGSPSSAIHFFHR